MALPNRSSIQTFDGQNKTNDQFQPPANQPLNWDNTKLGPCTGDVAALGLVSPRCWLRVTLAATTGALVLVGSWALWSNATVTLPTLTRTNTGIFVFSMPVMVSDEYDASFNLTNNISVNLFAARGSLEGTTPGFINASATDNIITVNTFNSGGSPNDLVGSNIFVVAY